MLKVCVAPTRTCPVRPPLPGSQHRDALVDLLQGPHREGEEQLAGLGRDDLLADAVEERLADLVLELADLVRERRLGDVHALGGAGEAEALGEGDEVAKMPQLHGNPDVESMPSIISMAIDHLSAAPALVSCPGSRRPAPRLPKAVPGSCCRSGHRTKNEGPRTARGDAHELSNLLLRSQHAERCSQSRSPSQRARLPPTTESATATTIAIAIANAERPRHHARQRPHPHHGRQNRVVSTVTIHNDKFSAVGVDPGFVDNRCKQVVNLNGAPSSPAWSTTTTTSSCSAFGPASTRRSRPRRSSPTSRAIYGARIAGRAEPARSSRRIGGFNPVQFAEKRLPTCRARRDRADRTRSTSRSRSPARRRRTRAGRAFFDEPRHRGRRRRLDRAPTLRRSRR